MKSYVDHVLATYEGVLLDAYRSWPDLRASLERDLSRLRRASETKGLPFFTIILPDLDKWFVQSLAAKRRLPEGIPRGIPIRDERPEIFSGLFDLVFGPDGQVLDHADPNAVFFLRTLMCLCKKLRLECSDARKKDSLNEFFSIEASLPRSWPNTWDHDDPTWQERLGHPLWGPSLSARHHTPDLIGRQDDDSIPWDSLRRLSRRVISEFGEPSYWELEPRHGPGAVSVSLKRDESKYSFRNWPKRLDAVFPYDWFATGLMQAEYDYTQMEHPSRLIMVPKTAKGPRIICAEPTEHQWIQQSIWRLLRLLCKESRFLSDSIDFTNQSRQQHRAVSASLGQNLMTVDLSSASDRVSTRLVEYIFQGNTVLLDMLHASRSRYLKQTISKDHDSVIVLRKFAPMGSAVCFPIQSIVFTILTVFSLRVANGTHETFAGLEDDFRQVTVFGDDIIAPAHCWDTMKRVFDSVGLKINVAKSFVNSEFAESCGMDAWRGVDVTPLYILEPYDGSPSSTVTTVEVANNAHRKGLWNASAAIERQLLESERKLIPVLGVDDGGLGLRSFTGRNLDHLPRGFDNHLQVETVDVLQVSDTGKRRQVQDTSGLTQYFTEKPSPDYPYSSGLAPRARLRKRRVRVDVNSVGGKD